MYNQLVFSRKHTLKKQIFQEHALKERLDSQENTG